MNPDAENVSLRVKIIATRTLHKIETVVGGCTHTIKMHL